MDITRKMALIGYRRLELQENCGNIKTLEPGTAEVDVATCSICGSDIALYRGKRSLENERYSGHESSGMVVDPGDDTNGIKEDIRVASELSRTCERCWNCHNGPPNYCGSVNDALLPGGFSRETLVLNMQEYNSISSVPGTIDDIIATPSEPTNCTYHVARQTNAKHEEIVVVFGMGPMDLIASRIIKSMDVGVVVRVDNSRARSEKVRSFGFIEVIDSNDGNWRDRMFEMHGSKGADMIVELTGALPVLQSAFQVAHPGGRIVMDNVYSGPAKQVELLPIMRKELTIRDSKGPYPHPKTDGTSAAVDILVRLQDDLKKLITVYDYKDVLKVFDGMMSGLAIKPVTRFRS